MGAAGFFGTKVERSFMPKRSSGDLRLELELPAGTPLEETAATVAVLAEEIGEDEAVLNVFSQVGRTERTGRLIDPSGSEIAIDNREPESVYFVASKEYRFYKIKAPRTGSCKMESVCDCCCCC